MISELRCNCKFGQLLFKVIDTDIEIKCRGCREKRLISIHKLLSLGANKRPNENITIEEAQDAST